MKNASRAGKRRRRPNGDDASRASRVIDAMTGALGHPSAVAAAATIVIAWVVFGPFFHYSDTYQLVINTATTIVTFVMVFAIQHTTNRETRAINLKLDELLESIEGARNKLVGVENKSEAAIKKLQAEERERAEHEATHHRRGRRRSGTAA